MDDWTEITHTGAGAVWDDVDESGLDDYMVDHSQIQPWAQGSHGKFVITPQGEFHSWGTSPTGEPHHDEVAADRGIQQVLKGEIAPSGAWWMTDVVDPSADPEEWASRVGPQAQQAGLRPVFRGYSAKVAEKLDRCDHCLKPYEQCTCNDTADWAEDPVADPVRDLKSPVESAFRRVIPESRWSYSTT